ncbi:exonuclease SbcC [Salinibacillus kushneri]|uniref:Nuclease SbcCD subunit C n=1 Tax=Salinibacillus kushneri TaxID=237682 RepID=A0A1I0DJ40_9BACI|nr:AAA family ATPase [Salinibacillus kushneri]SET32461.1 exonuclease SbcC [Salinibacillus kushneri]
MRAITLKMCAFGPYKEAQIIDFSQLGEEKLFLITGPTGAGKTTVFDAMCFALYGRASGDDRDHDTLRSHFAGVEELTQVSFRFQLHQKEFEIVRSPKQMKPKARGEGYTEQPPQAEIYQIIDGEKHLLYAKVKEVNEAVEDMLQLDYEQFRKMVMIPQGEFRRLISENSKEREEILQKIFHTYFYEQMTKRLAEESKSIQQQLEQIENQEQQEISYINWPEEYRTKNAEPKQARKNLLSIIENVEKYIDEQNNLLQEKRSQQKKRQDEFYAAKEVQTLFEEYDQRKQELSELKGQQEEIDAQKQQLKQAKNAAGIKAYEQQVKVRRDEHKKLEETLGLKREKQQQMLESFNRIEQEYQKAKEAEQDREKLKDSIRFMKEQLEKVKQAADLEKQKKELASTYQEEKPKLDKVNQRIEKIENDIEKLDEETGQSQQVTEQFYEFNTKLKEFDQLLMKTDKLSTENQLLKNYRIQYRDILKKYENNDKYVEQLREELQQLEDAMRNEKAALLAADLAEGQACPVCGSTHHPQRAEFHNASITDEMIASKRNQLQQSEQKQKEVQNEYVNIKSKGTSQNQTVENLQQEIEDLSGVKVELDEIDQRIQEWQNERAGISAKRNELDKQLNELKQKQEKQRQLKEELSKSKKEQQEKHESLQSLKEQGVKIQSQLENVKASLENPDDHYATVKERLSKAETEYEQQINKWNQLQKDYEQIKEHKQTVDVEIESLQKQLQTAQITYQEVRQTFETELENKGFKTLQHYEQAKMAEAEIEKTEERISTFEEKISITKNRYNQLTIQLNEKKRPDLETLEQSLKQVNEEIDAKTRLIQEQQLQLDRYLSTSERLHQLAEEKQELEEYYFDIGELAKLSRGDNQLRLSFERYVLSSFLDEILFQANIRLDQMTDHRYQLRRSDQVAKRGAQSGLDIEVIDNYTGQNRSVKTLSGGEGFKAALSLALGMADVVQAHSGGVELDTLFIDEGFGTLDELSLEQALNCLSDLQKGNRMLGIISHVQKLKEEIRAKLHIEPSHSGSKVSLTVY